MNVNDKINYFINSCLNFFSEKKCPFCGQKNLNIIDRKYLVTTLNSCNNCQLMFRHPIDNENFNLKFYNKNYTQSGITTDLPSTEELKTYLNTKFSDSNRSIINIKNILETLSGTLANKSILDYGCSWGYTTWQFKDIGMIATGYEINKDRAVFGNNNLNISIHTQTEDITEGPFKFIFSSHVIEHLPDIKKFIDFCFDNLEKNGYVILLSPNGSKDFKTKYPLNFHLFWGQVHPNMISSEFYATIFKDYPYYISSNPYNAEDIKKWDQKTRLIDPNGGEELLCIVKKV